MHKKYINYSLDRLQKLLAIDSPTGYTKKVAEFVYHEFASLGFKTAYTNKGGVLVDLGGEGSGLLLEGHVDTLGAMVASIKENGRLKLTNLGGMRMENGEGENVKIYTRDEKVYTGTLQIENASVHVNRKYGEVKRDYENSEVVIDEDVNSKEDVKKLGIDVGDIVCFNPRTVITESGYIKSRFLDDKLSVSILMAFAKYIKDNKVNLKRHLYMHITVYEEVGHGGSASVPKDVVEAISVDMGCVGNGLECNERMVSICVKDSGGPYAYEVVNELVKAAKKEKAKYGLDVYPAYGSDVEATLASGYDIKHGLIGPGVYASHGYERSHIEGIKNTLLVLKGYLNI